MAELVTIGYIAPTRRRFGWLPAAMLVSAALATLLLIAIQAPEFFCLGLALMFVPGIIALRILPRAIFRWVNADGTNSHHFVSPAPMRMAAFEVRIHSFRNEEIDDPHLGTLATLYTEKTWTAKLGEEKVFEIRRIRGHKRLKALAANPALKGMRLEVRADLRLHPDTIERLVEKFVTGQDPRQVQGYVRAQEKAQGSA